jgi:hypothetical protein
MSLLKVLLIVSTINSTIKGEGGREGRGSTIKGSLGFDFEERFNHEDFYTS